MPLILSQNTLRLDQPLDRLGGLGDLGIAGLGAFTGGVNDAGLHMGIKEPE